MIWYGYTFDTFSDQSLKVYQLGLTAFAATVGIGTVINSSKSTEFSRRSIEMTQSKESREQSSHLVTSSQVNTIKMSPPIYKFSHVYSPTKYVSKSLNNLIYARHHSPVSYSEAKKEFKKALTSIKEERIDGEDKLNMLHLLNIGKGVCLNAEYNFKFINIDDFNDYSVLYDIDKQGAYDLVAPGTYPSYDLVTEHRNGNLRIIIVDHFIYHLAEQVSMDDHEKDHYSVWDSNFFSSEQTTYIPFLEPGEDIYLPIPNEFMILCKHYLIMQLYKKQDNKSPISKFVRPGIQHLIERKAVSPVGQVTMSYMDEEDVKAKNNIPVRKELIFNVSIKDDSIYKHGDDIRFYLEFTPISKESQKRRKNEATAM